MNVEIDDIHGLIRKRVQRINQLIKEQPEYADFFDLGKREIVSFGIELAKLYPSKIWPQGTISNEDIGYFAPVVKSTLKS